ncbi:uncharacterized protein LOC132746641 [Ruditapes philippinarum]|uniref:uncharacterized protein LOC132746641 n=1 Tax=Ruditapes philippinarum TaxID=129788 RepID=UPI00295A621C|nr:uncharacterized protein LOC132746641 [Ruditapes philippinarum]
MNSCYGHVFCILEVCLLISQIGLTTSHGHLSDTERRIVQGFTGVQDGQVHLFDSSRQTNLPNVLAPDSHVDLPGEHGNQSPHPVIHRHRGENSHISHVRQHGNDLHTSHSNAHVDLPGQHGNESPFPAVHRQSGSQANSQGPHLISPGSHVDLPGQHGNDSPLPAVHRQSGSHIGLSGQHGNEHLFPANHRQTGSHVDLPGQHGNDSPLPAVHRQSGSHIGLSGQHDNEHLFPANHRQTGSHVDLPGQHGNNSPHPAVHRDTHSSGHHDHMSESAGAHRQSFVDPVSGTPVVISAPRNNIPFFPDDHHDAPNMHDHSHSLDATRGNRPPFLPGIIHPHITGPPRGLPLMPVPVGVPFPGQRGLGRPFGGPLLPVFLRPPPFFVPPEVIGMGPYRGLRRGRMMRRLSPPFHSHQSPPRRIGLGEIIAGAIGSLLGNISRQ